MNAVEATRRALRLHHLAAHPGAAVEDFQHLLMRCGLRELAMGEHLCQEGEASRDIYLLLEGEAEVQRQAPDGADRVLATLTAPEVIGHVAAIDGRPRSASVVAVTPCTVAVIPASEVERLLPSPTPEGTALRRLLMRRLHSALSRSNAQLSRLLEQLAGIQELSSDWVAALSTTSSLDTLTDEQLLELAGLTEGWEVDVSGLDDIDVEPVAWDE